MQTAPRRYAALTSGSLATREAKTAHGVIAYSQNETVVVIDPAYAGKRVREVVPSLTSEAPVVATLAEAMRFEPTALLIGVAPTGGQLPPAWRATILQALEAGLEIVNGLHHTFGDDPEFAAVAARSGARIWDVRLPPPSAVFTGAAYGVASRVVLTVGSDCAVGKMTASLELTKAAQTRGVKARFVATGQTGIMIAGSGITIDRVISDFASGATEQLVLDNTNAAELLFVEGQGSIVHPAYAPVTLGLLYGAAPDALVFVHEAGRTVIEPVGTPIPPLPVLIDLYERLCTPVKPAKVVGIVLNTRTYDDAGARRAIEQTRAETGLPADDIVRFGSAAFYDAIAPAIAHKTTRTSP